MHSQLAKLDVPTVATCRWRRVQGPETSAECGLVALLTGITSGDDHAVSLETCEACCRSFPPTPKQLNPVVASLVYKSASRILEVGGTAECSAEHASEIKRLAEESLDLIHPERFRLNPARASDACCWLGETIHSRDVSNANGDVAQSPSPDPNGDETVYVCRHPAHELTTVSRCRMCRDWTKDRPISRFLSLNELVPPPARRCGPAVRRWAVGVTTAPRRQPTLEACLDSVVRAGWDEPRLFLDGISQLPARYSHLAVTCREDRIGAWPAWYLALAELVLQQPDADAYVMLQDDVIAFDRSSLRAYLEEVLWPGDRPGLVSLFYTAHDTTAGWHRAGENWHWGAQALVFPPGVARALLSDVDLAQACLAASADIHIPIPELLGEWVSRRGIETWYACPSLTQHIGNTSTIWMNAAIAGGRRAAWFSGSVETPLAAGESLADFPEDAFPCQDLDRKPYVARVEFGRQRMRQHSVVLCGVCRDVRPLLPRMAARVERLGDMFQDYRVVVVDDGSRDATREFLRDWQKLNPRVDILSTVSAPRSNFPLLRSDVTSSLIASLNRCRTHILENYADFDLVIVFDTDVIGGWSFEGIAHTFGEADWDVVGSYGLRQRQQRQANEPPFSHFDAWAFRPTPDTSTPLTGNELRLRRGEPLLAVESCFGGLAIYKMECFAAAEYGGGDCEHVVFHRRIRRAGFTRIFLNPSQIVVHSPF